MTLIGIIFIIVLTLAFLATYKFPKLEIYRKYLFILVPAVCVIILMLLKRSKPVQTTGSTPAASAITQKIDDVRTQLNTATAIATVKQQMIAEDKTEELAKLKEIEQIKDNEEQLKQLALLIG